MNKLEQLKKEAGPEIYKSLQRAAKIVEEMDGISISVDKKRWGEVMDITEPLFEEVYKESKWLVHKVMGKIRRKANEKLNKGMDGNGTYFID